MAMYPDEFTIQETFLDGIPAEMCRTLIHNNNLSPEVNTVTEFLMYAIRYKQSACTATHYNQRSSRHAQGHRQLVKVGTFLAKHAEMEQNCNLWSLLEATQDTSQVLQQHNATTVAELDCKAPKAQVQAAHTAAADSNAESNAEEDQEELVNDEEVPLEVEDPEAEDDAESVHIDGDEYVMVDIYDNEYYTREDDEEHLFALTEYQGDTC
ncbi:hypothetical protein C0995_014823 [Termitomyces sp. Mi166|nr:hypothetical protein C0995_014823 [Termitomyces sp. Mi166\